VALTTEWDTDLLEVVVWYYDADMAAVENLEEELRLGRSEKLDLAPLECPSAPDAAKGGGGRAQGVCAKNCGDLLIFFSKG